MSVSQTLCVLKCFMTSIHRQSSEELTFSFVITLLQSLWYVTASGANVPNVWAVFKIYFAIFHKFFAINNVQQSIRLNKQKGKKSFCAFALHLASHVTHPGHLL